MVKTITKYVIMANQNYGGRRTLHSYTSKQEANKKLKQILSPAKSRVVRGRRIYLTSYRDAQSGTGIKNPRIKKVRGFA